MAESLADRPVHGMSLRARVWLIESMKRHGLSEAEIGAIFEDSGLNDAPPEGE